MTIPISDIISANPGVLGAGGTPIAINGGIMSESTQLPTGAVQPFSTPDAVAALFGTSSTEYAMAVNYFLGYDNSTIKPAVLYFAPFVNTARGAWLRSGSLAGVTLTTLQGYSGHIILPVDGVSQDSGSVNLSSATSFTDAASIITTAFDGVATCAWDAITSTFVISSTTTGASSTIGFATGALATSLLMLSTSGGTLSQGANVDTEASAMNMVKSKTQNWGLFTTTWEPNLASKEAFSAWSNSTNNRYGYIAWDTDAQAIVANSTACFGYILKSLNYSGTAAVSGSAATASEFSTTLAATTRAAAAMILGTAASINFLQTNGRITFAFKSQSGMIPTVDSETSATNLLANGYSFYGQYNEINNQFNIIYDGKISGIFLWIDTYVNQIWLNSNFRLALMDLFTNIGSAPYNQQGYSLIRAAMSDPINAALNFGAIRTGVELSMAQIAEVNAAAGLSIANTIQTQGYYLQILDPGATVRGQRGSPIINFWYTDGGAIQKITLSSIDIL